LILIFIMWMWAPSVSRYKTHLRLFGRILGDLTIAPYPEKNAAEAYTPEQKNQLDKWQCPGQKKTRYKTPFFNCSFFVNLCSVFCTLSLLFIFSLSDHLYYVSVKFVFRACTLITYILLLQKSKIILFK